MAVATAATRATKLVDAVLAEALEDALQGNYSPGMRSAVAAIEQWLDEQAWDLQAQGESARADRTDYEQAFRRARAAGSVKANLDGDTRVAVNEAIYEAGHAVNRDERLVQLLGAVLDLPAAGNHWAACELARLFWPEFVEVDGYVLLASHYSQENLTSWRERHPENRAAVEDVINHVHLEDLSSDRAPHGAIATVGEALTSAWRSELRSTLPGRAIRVELDGSILTAFSER